jgi:restriction endonuclease S subunit
MSKYLFTKKIKLKDRKHFQWENGIWTGKEKPLIKIKILRNTNFNGNGFFDFGNVAEIEIEEKYLPRKLLLKNDILIERSGGGPNTPVGRAAFYNGENNLYSFSNFTSRVRIISDEIDPEFFHKYLLYLHWNKHTEKIQTQTTNIRNLEFEKYLSFEVLLPETKKEQQRINDDITEKLATVERMHQAALRQKEAVEALQGALLREVFPYKEGDKLLEGWKWESIGNMLEEYKVLVQPFEKEFEFLPFIGLENITSNSREYADDEYNPPESTCFRFNKNTLLFGKLRPYLNKIYLPDSEGKSSMELIPLKPKSNFTREFIAAVLQSEAVIGNTVRFSTGSRMPRANLNKLKNLKVAIPVNPMECNEIGNLVTDGINKINKLENKAKFQLESIEALPAAILREVFEFKS